MLHRVADLYAKRSDELAAIITREMGKTMAEARGEVEFVVDIYRYYADNGPEPCSRTSRCTPTPGDRMGAQGADRGRCSGSCRGTTRTTRLPDSPART